MTSEGGINKHRDGLSEESMEPDYLKVLRVNVSVYEAI